jgi:hypothetical protein
LNESIFRFDNPGLSLTVYADRLEIAVRKRHQTIPLADVAEVSAMSRPKRLLVVTTAGKRIELSLGGYSEDARAAIAHQLNEPPR